MIIMIAIALATIFCCSLHSRFQNSGVKGLYSYNIGIIACILGGELLGFVIEVLADEVGWYSSSYTIHLLIFIGGIAGAGMIYRTANRKLSDEIIRMYQRGAEAPFSHPGAPVPPYGRPYYGIQPGPPSSPSPYGQTGSSYGAAPYNGAYPGQPHLSAPFYGQQPAGYDAMPLSTAQQQPVSPTANPASSASPVLPSAAVPSGENITPPAPQNGKPFSS